MPERSRDENLAFRVVSTEKKGKKRKQKAILAITVLKSK